MTDYLLVPIHVETLFLTEDQVVTEASADFTRIPYCNTQRDINPDIANISEEIVSIPFQNQNLYLKAGIHLHWFLPSALTEGQVTDRGTTFPAVPNRWLITRRTAPEAAPAQWVVESDYIHPEGQGEGWVAFPVSQNGPLAPFRRLGRTMSLEQWLQPKNPPAGEYLETLTAVGYGELTFAAFYPNCYSVFGFFDSEFKGSYPDGLEYIVIGWYSHPEKDDFLRKYLENRKELKEWQEIVAALKTDFDWDLPKDEQQVFPRQMVCFGAVSHPVQDFVGGVEKVAIANSGVEALSAYLAHTIADGQHEKKALFEEQLEFLSIRPKLVNNRLDLDAKYRENRHERGFNAVYGGTQWTVRLENQPEESPDAGGGKAKELLPLETARLLGDLNRRQREYDRSMREITEMRQQLFSDWYKYMLCVYPPEGASDDYPDIDKVKYFIETQDLRLLEERVRTNDGLARDLQTQLDDLRKVIARYNETHEDGPYILEPIPASRFWEPKEPVVLIVDEAGSPLLQKQADPVNCLVVNSTDVDALVTKKVLDQLQEKARSRPADGKEQPWHSLFLEWQVQYFPMREGSNVFPTNQDFRENYINGNYTLPENGVELQKNPEKKTLKGAEIYSGYSILTPYAGIQLEQKISEYLQEIQDIQAVYQDWRDAAPDRAENTSFQAWLGEQIDSLIQRYEHSPGFKGEKDPIYTFLHAFKAMQNRVFLSQALSGFNSALLMHKQTMQLPISDPLGFPEYQQFAARVTLAIAGENKTAPQPLDDFNPIRAGGMNIQHLRVIDTFGRVKELYPGEDPQHRDVVPAEPIWPQPGENFHAMLPPRLAQPARLHFRWLAADSHSQMLPETNAHPATGPVCGWLLPNNLDHSIMVYDQVGTLLGSLKADLNSAGPASLWRPAPGRAPVAVTDIANPHLQKLVEYFSGKDGSFLERFLGTLGSALENIDPENFRLNIGMALLTGRPVAVARANLRLELLGRPAVHHGWNVFRQDIVRETRDTNAFERVKFPVRLGDAMQLDDSLVCYWKENEDGTIADSSFFTPQTSASIDRSLQDPPLNFILLLDPRGKVHATCGILPAKAIDIPPEYYADVLKHLEVTFLSAPVLTNPDSIQLPIPAEPGYVWTWLEYQKDTWREKDIHPIGLPDDFSARQEIREGWLKLKPAEETPEGNREDKGA